MHISLTGQNKTFKRTFDVNCVELLRCANKECEFSHKNANNVIHNIFRNSKDEFPIRVYIHPSKYIFSSVFPLKKNVSNRVRIQVD